MVFLHDYKNVYFILTFANKTDKLFKDKLLSHDYKIDIAQIITHFFHLKADSFINTLSFHF